jgi:hypothetical protein
VHTCRSDLLRLLIAGKWSATAHRNGNQLVTKRLLAIAAIALALSLSACSSGTDAGAQKTEPPAPTTSAAAPNATEGTAPALSDNEKLVKTFVDALDTLGIEHSEPKRTEAALLSTASYDMTVSGFDAKVQVFASEETQTAWVKASDSFGGVCVVIDGAALSLNSSEGVADSAKIAPKIAETVGGEAHGN